MRRELERIDIPGEHDARVRTWALVQAAFAEREPAARRGPSIRPLLALAALAAVAAAALSPPGMALIDRVREAIGVEQAAPALFSLPAEGRLLAVSDAGAWVVRPDGSRRLLAGYRAASWSPNGLFVVAARRNELVALEPDGDVRWKLARPDVRAPRWAGLRGDTRIAYLSEGSLRVVAGDGTGDRVLATQVQPVPPAWRPGDGHVLALSDREGRIHVYGADRRALNGRSRPGEPPLQLAWFPDGRRLLALAPRSLRILDFRGRLMRSVQAPAGARNVAAAIGPKGELALIRRVGGRSELIVAGRRIFSGAGSFTDLAWSPDGRWLLLAWRDADQWLFIRSAGVRKVEAVSGITAQFEGRAFPGLSGWCCAP